MKIISVLTIIIVVLMIFVKCQSNEVSESADVNQDKIYQQYRINYYEESNKVSVEATFRFDGKNGNTLNLSEPSKVTINGEVLNDSRKLFGGREYNGSIKFKNNNMIKINFMDFNNKNYQQIIKVKPVGKIKVPNQVKKGESFTISWENKIEGDDKMYITLRENYNSAEHMSDDLQTESSAYLSEIATNGENSIYVDGSVFRNLHNDTVYVDINKDKMIDLQQETASGGIIFYRQPVYGGMIVFK